MLRTLICVLDVALRTLLDFATCESLLTIRDCGNRVFLEGSCSILQYSLFLSGGFGGKAFAAINIGRDYFTNPMHEPYEKAEAVMLEPKRLTQEKLERWQGIFGRRAEKVLPFTAHHEAGHAVAACVLGLRFVRVHVIVQVSPFVDGEDSMGQFVIERLS
jgi:hypothetical protein